MRFGLTLGLFACRATESLPADTDAGGEPLGCSAAYPDHTVGLIACDPAAAAGYTLFAPNLSTTTYLIDNFGQLVHSWESDYKPGHSVSLLENGHLLRTAQDSGGTPFFAGGAAGRVQEFDWDGTLLWDFAYKSSTYLSHHDLEPLPSGNVLLIAWEAFTEAEALAAGRDPETVAGQGVWADTIIEIDPTTDAIVWEWRVWDHVVQDYDATKPNYGDPADAPGRIDLNLAPGSASPAMTDWNHINGVAYNAALDQIVMSSHNQDEIWVIDHDTTTSEAAGPAGDLLYRWGNPGNYGATGDKILSGQHDAEWIPDGSPGAGNLLVFNNGVGLGGSSVLEISPPVEADGSYSRTPGEAFGPLTETWRFEDPPDFYSSYIGGSQRLPNGNTLICEGASGHFFEVTPEGEVVWDYINPVGAAGPVAQGTEPSQDGLNLSTFRADRYAPDYPGFAGRDLTPAGVIER